MFTGAYYIQHTDSRQCVISSNGADEKFSLFCDIQTIHQLVQITVPKGDVTFRVVASGTETIKTKLGESSALIWCARLNSHNFQNKAPN